MDGGLQKWKSDGFKTTGEVPQVAQGNFKASVDQNIRKDAKFMKENLAKKDVQVLDSRPPNLYKGNPDGKLNVYKIHVRSCFLFVSGHIILP